MSGATHSYRVTFTDPSHVGEARRLAATVGAQTELDENDVGKVAIIISELANNLVRYAKGGELLVRALGASEGEGVEVVALDHGPGMDFEQCSRDGYSTGGTPGNGLGAIQRLASSFAVHSDAAHGTIMVARVHPRTAVAKVPSYEVGRINVPVLGESVCGDSAAVEVLGSRARALVVDGLGHGPEAAHAAEAAVAVFHRGSGLSLVDLLEAMHVAMRGTRGAAVGIAAIDPSIDTLQFVGVGNIAGTIITRDGTTRSLVSHAGIAGHEMRRVQVFSYPWQRGSILVMASDGLGTRWDLRRYHGLVRQGPSVIGATLFRDFERKRDDATVLTLAESGA